jgi:hypothetical protein
MRGFKQEQEGKPLTFTMGKAAIVQEQQYAMSFASPKAWIEPAIDGGRTQR